MAEVKNYGLSGVHRTLQLGKQGPVLVGNADTDSFTVTLQDGATLTNMGGANATNSAHFITKAQLDVVYTEAVFKANVNYNDSSPILLGNISSGTKTIITTLTIGTAFDDANAIVTIGTTGNNTLLMSDDYCEIENTGVYQTINTVEIASDTALNIYVTQAGATTGAGNVLVSVVDGPVVNGGTINYGAGGNSPTNTITNTDGYNNFHVTVEANGLISMNTARGGLEIGAMPEIGAPQHLHIMRPAGQGSTTDLYFGDDYNYIRMPGLYGSGTQGVDIGSSYNNGTVHVWRFDTDGNLKLPAGGGIVDSTGNSVLGVGGITLANISVTSNSPSGNGSLTYNNSTGVFTFTPANLSSVVSNYGNSNVTTLLSSFGSNTISTTGNISGSNISATGTTVTGIAAITAGVTNTLLPNTVASFSANVNNYTQVTLQNKSTGADATADFVITADNGSDTVNYADFGIINSGYDNTTPTNSLGNIVFAADTYLYAQGNASATSQSGGNIAIGTTVSGKTVKIFAGGANSTAIVGTFSGTAGLAITGNISATGITKAEQIHEIFTTKTSATGTVTHDCSTGQVFSHSSISANFTANFTNLNLDSGYATTITLILNQGGTAYIPNAVQIGGVGQTINWQGGSAPTGNANKKDVASFSILNSSGTYTVLGQLTTFG